MICRWLPMLAGVALAMGTATVHAQDASQRPQRSPLSITTDDTSRTEGVTLTEEEVPAGRSALLRGLDKVSGDVTDITLVEGEATVFGSLSVELLECRYPPDRQASEAFAHLRIAESTGGKPIFDGWMIASSPALSALDHARYDVWVLRCRQG
ncbi:MAG: DUF2155 domain-containing protein [Paracoccaceae bacterium]